MSKSCNLCADGSCGCRSAAPSWHETTKKVDALAMAVNTRDASGRLECRRRAERDSLESSIKAAARQMHEAATAADALAPAPFAPVGLGRFLSTQPASSLEQDVGEAMAAVERAQTLVRRVYERLKQEKS